MLFQVVNNLAGIRLRYAVRLGSARKAAKIDDVAKRLEEAQMHSDFKTRKRRNRGQHSPRFLATVDGRQLRTNNCVRTDYAVSTGSAAHLVRRVWSRNSALSINYLNTEANQD